MITILGILIGALIIGQIWTCVHLNEKIAEIRSETRGPKAYYNPTTYSGFSVQEQIRQIQNKIDYLNDRFEKARDSKEDIYGLIDELADEREMTKECIKDLVAQQVKIKQLSDKLDKQMEEGLLLIENYDKRGIG